MAQKKPHTSIFQVAALTIRYRISLSAFCLMIYSLWTWLETFYIPSNVLCRATSVMSTLITGVGLFFWERINLGVHPALLKIAVLMHAFLRRSYSLSLSLHIIKWNPKDIKWRIYGHHIFKWRATKPYEVSFGTARFCFLCLALLVFSLLLQSAYNFLLFIFIGI